MASKHHNQICDNCIFVSGCDETCAAIKQLCKINEEQKIKDKTILIKNLARQLGFRDAEVSEELKALANKIINKFGYFSFINEYEIKIGYVISYETKGGEKITYADCRKLQEVYKAYLPYDYIITFYNRNTGCLNENQKKILMLHELKHIEIGMNGLKIRVHDIEDFAEILNKYGNDWNTFDKDVPDILKEGE